MRARRPVIRSAIVGITLLFFIGMSFELLRRSNPEPALGDAEMLYPQIISGVWVTGFEESSFFPGAKTIPDRNDPRRYRVELIVDPAQVNRVAGHELRGNGYRAVAITFLGRRSKYPTNVDCYGGRSYFFIPDWIFSARELGSMADPDIPEPSQVRSYEPFKRSGEGGVIAELENRALAHCGGS